MPSSWLTARSTSSNASAASALARCIRVELDDVADLGEQAPGLLAGDGVGGVPKITVVGTLMRRRSSRKSIGAIASQQRA